MPEQSGRALDSVTAVRATKTKLGHPDAIARFSDGGTRLMPHRSPVPRRIAQRDCRVDRVGEVRCVTQLLVTRERGALGPTGRALSAPRRWPDRSVAARRDFCSGSLPTNNVMSILVVAIAPPHPIVLSLRMAVAIDVTGISTPEVHPEFPLLGTLV